MDFDFLSSNLQIAYPFQQNVTVGRAGADTELASVVASARIRTIDQRDERLTLEHVYLESSDGFATFDEADIRLAWQPSGDLITLSHAGGTAQATVQAYGSWIVAEWYAPNELSGAQDMVVKLIFPDSATEEPASSSSSSSSSVVVIQLDEIADELTFQPSVVSQGPNKIRRVYWKHGDTLELVADKGEDLIIQAGFNMSIGAGSAVSSNRALTQIAMNAVPGAGLGQYLICQGSQYLITMNGVGANDQGELTLNPQECYWQSQDVAGEITHVPTSHGVSGTATLKPNEVKLNNSCGPCCSCENYVETYENLHRLWEQAQAVSEKIYALSSNYELLVADYEEIAACTPIGISFTQRVPEELVITLLLCNDTDIVLNNDISGDRLTFELDLTIPGGMTLSYTNGSGFVKSTNGSNQLEPTELSSTEFEIEANLPIATRGTLFWVGTWKIGADYDGKTVEAAVLARDGDLPEPRSASASITLELEA